MSNKLKIAAFAVTLAAGTFAASLMSTQAQAYVIEHGGGHRRGMCLREGGIYEGNGVCQFPGRVHYRHAYPERVRTNGYWDNGVWHYYR